MRPTRRVLGVAAAFAASLAVVGTTAASAAPASAPTAAHSVVAAKVGTTSLAQVLIASGGAKWDKSWNDYNILTHAVLAVLAAKPNSPVKVLTEGNVRLTAFIPNDNAFRALVASLTGKLPKTEQATFAAVAGLGIPTVEKVLLYHVVPGATILSGQAVKANGARLKTALGSTIFVRVYSVRPLFISLWDKDHNAANPRLIASQLDINKGNAQVAHGINRVLRPVDLPPLAHH